LVEAADFPRGNINPTWEWEDILFNYGTGASQVVLNENTVTLTLSPQGIGQPLQGVWSDAIAGKQWAIDNQTITRASASSNLVSIKGVLGEPSLILTGELDIKTSPDVSNLRVLDPKKYFLESFQEILSKEGIRVGKAEIVKSFISSNLETLFSTIESPILSELLKKVNQDSNNLYTESLAFLLSKNQLENNLTNLGVDQEGYNLIDGSGLSRQNLITPETLVKTLILMTRSPYGEVYKNSLAMAGKTGTLQGRFKDTVVEGKLRAKTGTLSGNSALSGYLDTENNGVIIFSIIVNGSDQNVSILRSGIDEIVLNLAKLKKC
jgi:D-alanyl-D-alanine carboxypeptidase/D-alanyl-D-alanine-endopeptidase (penicillin-binding protein 4)